MPPTVMIVEDEPLMRKGLAEMIDQYLPGFHAIYQAENGLQALDWLEKLSCDIVMADISMPHMDGIELARRLKAEYPEIVTVFLTGFNEFKYAQASIRHNVFDYILKPVDMPVLSDTLERAALESSRRRMEKSRSSMMQIHLSGKMTRLYTLVTGHEFVIALRAANAPEVERITGRIMAAVEEIGEGRIDDMRQLAYWVLRTLFSLYPELQHETPPDAGQALFGCDDARGLKKELLEVLGQVMQHQKSLVTKSASLNRIKQYIVENYNQDISLQLLGEVFGLNPTYISNLFKTMSNQNFLEFLHEVRNNEAFDLLKSTNLKIYEVAELVGYQDANYFTRAFKKEVGMTPGEFREKIGGKP